MEKPQQPPTNDSRMVEIYFGVTGFPWSKKHELSGTRCVPQEGVPSSSRVGCLLPIFPLVYHAPQ